MMAATLDYGAPAPPAPQLLVTPHSAAGAGAAGAWGACGLVHAAIPSHSACGENREFDDDDAASSTTEELMTCAQDSCQAVGWPAHAASPQPADKPAAKGRKAAAKAASCKQQRMCMYEHCPSPMHSSKWRVVTATTVAGGRDWQSLFGMTLCDSCYSTYRKHGTFIRSVRTAEGWARFDHSAQTHILNKPSKKRVSPTPRPVKRSRAAAGVEPASKRRAPSLVNEDDSDSANSLDLLAGRPRRERKPSAKLRDVLTGPGEDHDGDVQSRDDDEEQFASDSSDYSSVDTPSTTHATDHQCWGGDAAEYSVPRAHGAVNREQEDVYFSKMNDHHELDSEAYQYNHFQVPLVDCTHVPPVDSDSFFVF